MPELDECAQCGISDRLKTISNKRHVGVLPLFLTLPLEIRLLIYEFAFGDSRLIASKFAASYYSPLWDGTRCITNIGGETNRHQIMLTCHQCYVEGNPVFYGMTNWPVDSADAALWRPENRVSAFWTHVNIVKEMRIWGDEGAEILRPAEFPTLQRLSIYLGPIRPREKVVHNGKILEMPAHTSSDQEIITWVMATAQYKRSVKHHFDSQRNFDISVEVTFGWSRYVGQHMVSEPIVLLAEPCFFCYCC